MITIGLVGRVGSGKSTVAGFLGEQGAIVVDADRIAHEMLTRPEVIREVAARHGADVVAADGSIDRRRLAARVFGPTDAHAAALAALEAIVHPLVRDRIETLLDAVRLEEAAGGPVRLVALDIPLLEKAGWADRCDRIVQVVCDEAVRQQRLMARGWNASEREFRDAAWDRQRRFAAGKSPQNDKKPFVVDTSGTPAYTLKQVERLLDEVAMSRNMRNTPREGCGESGG